MHNSNATNVRTRRADLAGTGTKGAPPSPAVPARKRQKMVGLSLMFYSRGYTGSTFGAQVARRSYTPVVLCLWERKRKTERAKREIASNTFTWPDEQRSLMSEKMCI
jgi:hypothetical protein